MMKKIICAGMAVAMMAALAIPASAGDLTNQTTVKFAYTTNVTPGPNVDTFKVTIPATVELTGGTELDNGGVDFTGTLDVAVDGVIQKDAKVSVYVSSANDYNLMDNTTAVAKYTMTVAKTTGKDAGVTITATNFSGQNIDCAVADFNAEAFNKESSATLTIKNTDSNEIYGVGTYTDVLTFTCDYNGAQSDSNVKGGTTPAA